VNVASLHEVLGGFPSGVAVITGIYDGRPVGALAGAFALVAQEPPLATFVLDRSAKAMTERGRGASFCVNVVASDQEWLCRHLGGVKDDPMKGIGWRATPGGTPIIDGVVSWIECRQDQVIDTGDHLLVVAEVTDLEMNRDALPLLAFHSGYGEFRPSTLVVANGQAHLDAVRLANVARPEMQYLATTIGAECTLQVMVGTDVVFVACANGAVNTGRGRLGIRVPGVAPFGALFVDSRHGPTEDQWLAAIPADEAERRFEAREQLERTRQRGYSISIFGEQDRSELDAMVRVYSDPQRTPEQETFFYRLAANTSVIHDPADEEIHPDASLVYLAVPVRDLDGQVVAVLRLGELPPSPTRDEVDTWLDMLQEASSQVEMRMTQTL